MQKVIIIEDDFLMAELLKHKINQLRGFRCNKFYLSADSYLFSRSRDKIIIMDILMPGKDGLEAIEIILKRHPECCIIINSAKDDLETILLALKKGAVGYIDKQSSEVDLQEVLDSVVAGGGYMTPAIAKKVMDTFKSPRNNFENLTEREKDITEGILEALSYKLIADKYNISVDTVRMHIRNIYRKLNINSKAELFKLSKDQRGI